MTGPIRRPGAARERPAPEPTAPTVDRALVAVYGSAPEVKHCKSCGAPIYFAQFRADGKPHPINADPLPDRGSIAIEDGAAVTLPKKERVGGVAPDGKRLLASHFSTCADAAKWRRPR